jgi:dTMP kinase
MEGLDGAGKSTQVRLLQDYLTDKGIPYQHVHFPRLGEEPHGALVAEFLRGEFGPIGDVHPKLVALLFAGDRQDFAPVIRQWLAAGYLVIADRYVHSNIAFQCAKLQDQQAKAQLKQWILDLEYACYQIPQPDLSIFLDVPPGLTIGALANDTSRDSREYLDGAEDIHESDSDFQSRVYYEYLDLVRRDERFFAAPCVDASGARMTPEAIHNGLLPLIRRDL